MINQHISNQEMIIEAALIKNMDLAFQAFYNDPANHLPIGASWEFLPSSVD